MTADEFNQNIDWNMFELGREVVQYERTRRAETTSLQNGGWDIEGEDELYTSEYYNNGPAYEADRLWGEFSECGYCDSPPAYCKLCFNMSH